MSARPPPPGGLERHDSTHQWNNNMFQSLIIQSVEQQHVSVPHHSVSGTTCFSPSSFSQWNNNMFQSLIIQSVEQQHVSVPHHSVSGTTTCFSPSSFSQWNNNMFQYLIIQSVEQQHVSVPHHSVSGTTTCFSPSSFSQWNNNMFQYPSFSQWNNNIQWNNNNMFPYLAVEVKADGHQQLSQRQDDGSDDKRADGSQRTSPEKKQRRDKHSCSFPGGRLCSREQEVGRVIDSWLGVVSGGAQQEGASWVLRLDGANDAEGGASEHLEPLLLGPGDPLLCRLFQKLHQAGGRLPSNFNVVLFNRHVSYVPTHITVSRKNWRQRLCLNFNLTRYRRRHQQFNFPVVFLDPPSGRITDWPTEQGPWQ
ncbi:hypothetical protein F7725_012275 [Dissostichus mawsoni]|uniref:Uncharacterized protein n=1 Tax=Dissostichus mawsoni TaxID=36200 RepID=A0A7J5YN12_DISMA|nr:hypothetical protein F7725_012275 [Dissostichus mawsoni]